MSGAREFESSAVGLFLRRSLPRDCLIVLTFHRVGRSLPSWHFGIEPDRLARTATAFARIARPVSLAEVAQNGIRGRMLALTFDDGFADNAEVAAPLLAKLGLPAAFFVTALSIDSGCPPWPDEAYARLLRLPYERLSRLALRLAPGWSVRTPIAAAHAAVHGLKDFDPAARRRVLEALPDSDGEAGAMMTWEQARSLLELGMDVGSHGLTHACLTTVDDAELERELSDSRRLVEQHLGRPCELLAYPDNRADERVLAAAAKAGYRLAVRGGQRVNLPDSNPLGLHRLAGEDSRLWAIAARTAYGPRRSLDFSAEADRYGAARENEYSFTTQAGFVESVFVGVRPRRVLDAGCGGGALVPWLERAGAAEIVGVDAAGEMAQAARRRYPRHRWIRADLRRLPFPGESFDAVASLGVLEYTDDPKAALRELGRVVRPGAPLVVSVPQRRSPNALLSRLYELARGGRREGSRPLSARRVERALAGAALEPRRSRSTNFFSFPLTAIAPRASWWLAARLHWLGSVPVVRRLGAQLLVEARRPRRRPLFWLAPALPTKTTFLDRELGALRRAGADVEPLAPPVLGVGALVAFARRPLRALLLGLELQRLKARRDRERGRVGYAVLFLRALTLAEQLQGRPGRLHATFADGVGTIAYGVHKLTGRPYSFTVHSPYSLWQRSPLLARQAVSADVVVCEANAVADRLRELAPTARTQVVPSPGPERVPPRGSTGDGLLLCVGRLIPHKGFATAIEAVALAIAHGYDVRLEIHGDGPERHALERVIERFDVGNRVELRGQTSNDAVLDRLGVALALLAPCEVQPDGDRDGLPVSIVDAALCATAVIATPVSSIPDLIVDGETGLLVPERNPLALAEAIERLARDPALAGDLGRSAQDRARHVHDASLGAEHLLRIWGDVDRPHRTHAGASLTREGGVPGAQAAARR